LALPRLWNDLFCIQAGDPHGATNPRQHGMEINMKTTLILSALGALSFASTTSFAQDYVSAYGNAQRTTSATAPYGNAHPTINAAAPVLGRFTASDFGFSEHGRPRERLHAPSRVPYGGYGGYSRYADYGAFGYAYGYLPDNYATYCGQFPKAC
jgi:hypothetical protein